MTNSKLNTHSGATLARPRAKRSKPTLRREKILSAAISVATRTGYRQLTRIDVGLRAKVSPSLVSKYFGCVDSLRKTVIVYALNNEILPIVAQIYSDTPRLVNLKLRKKLISYLKKL